MTPELQTLLTVSIPTIAVLIGILINNSRLGDMNGRLGDMNGRISDLNNRLNDVNVRLAEMRVHFDGRIDDLRDVMRAELRRVEEVFEARLTHLEDRLR